MKTHYILIPLLTGLLLAGCRQNAAEEAVAPDSQQETVVAETPDMEVAETPQTTQHVELVPVLRTPKQAAKPATTAKPAAQDQPKTAAQQPLKGTIYVETDAAQGRVWGHVTMNGDKGTGTIHDWDENTWAVSVTRHGDELFAVDQNSRLYVFKLKK